MRLLLVHTYAKLQIFLLPFGFVFQQDGAPGSNAHGPSDAGLVEGKLYRLHCKGRMATKFTRPQPT